MTQVIQRIFIGDWQEAKKFKENFPDSIVITCAKDSPWVGDVKFDLIDFNNEPENHVKLGAAIRYMRNQYKAEPYDKDIFVHCISGVTRCVAVVCGFLMRERGYTVEDAHNYLKQQYQRTKDYTPSTKVMSMLLDL